MFPIVLLLVFLPSLACSDPSAPKASAMPSEGERSRASTSDPVDIPSSPTVASPSSPTTGDHFSDTFDSTFPRPPVRPNKHKITKIELVFRSSPTGAKVSIDGTYWGTTPTFWEGSKDGQAHEYTFVKDEYAIARYRFVASHSGIVHGKLSRLRPKEEESRKTPSPAVAKP